MFGRASVCRAGFLRRTGARLQAQRLHCAEGSSSSRSALPAACTRRWDTRWRETSAKPTTPGGRGRRDFCAEHARSFWLPCKQMAGPQRTRCVDAASLRQPARALPHACDTTWCAGSKPERRVQVPSARCQHRHCPQARGGMPLHGRKQVRPHGPKTASGAFSMGTRLRGASCDKRFSLDVVVTPGSPEARAQPRPALARQSLTLQPPYLTTCWILSRATTAVILGCRGSCGT